MEEELAKKAEELARASEAAKLKIQEAVKPIVAQI
jgi:hypothetical protein